MAIVQSHKSFYKSIVPTIAFGALLTVPVQAHDLTAPLPMPQSALCVPLTDTAPPSSLWHFQQQPCPAVPQQTLAEAAPGGGVVVRVRPGAEAECWQVTPVHPGVLGWLQGLFGRLVPQGQEGAVSGTQD